MQDSTRDTLAVFVKKANRLRALRFTKRLTAESITYTIHQSQERGEREKTVAEHDGPDLEAIEAAILTIRQFTLKNERRPISFSFSSLVKIARSGELSEHWAAEVTHIVHDVNEVLADHIPYVLDGETYTRGYIFAVFVYGSLVHTDGEKVAILAHWEGDPFMYPLLEFEFINTLKQLLAAIFALACLCEDELAANGLCA